MKLVREHINEFKQGGNPYDTMGVGSNRPFKIGDRFKCTENIYFLGHGDDRYIPTKGTRYDPEYINEKIYILIKSNVYRNETLYQLRLTDGGYDGGFWFEANELKEFFERL
jgi:hypothetical protein